MIILFYYFLKILTQNAELCVKVHPQCEHLYKSWSSDSLQVWSIQLCISTTLKRKCIRNHLREATDAAHQSVIWNPSLESEKEYSTGEKHSKPFAGVDIPANSPQGQGRTMFRETSKQKGNTSDCTCLSMVNVKFMIIRLEKDWTSMDCLEVSPGGNFFSFKRTWQYNSSLQNCIWKKILWKHWNWQRVYFLFTVTVSPEFNFP